MKHIDQQACDAFFAWLAGCSDTSSDPAFNYLQEYLGAWLVADNGGAVEYTGRNYTSYLRVCYYIADIVFKGEEEMLSCPGIASEASAKEDSNEIRTTSDPPSRQVIGLLNPDPENEAVFLDSDFYATVAYQQEHGSRGWREQAKYYWQQHGTWPEREYPPR